MSDEVFINAEEKKRDMPAARCRDCGAITWVVNLSTGARKVTGSDHEVGCERPLGRLDLKASIPLSRQPDELNKPMSDEDIAQYD